MSEEKKPLTLAAKLARIGKEIGAVDKSGVNQIQRYKYIEYSVVAGRIRELFDIYRVIIVPSVMDYKADEVSNSKGGNGYHYLLTMNFCLINGDDPEDNFNATWVGEATDYGDKGINKAETSGTKYFLMRLFNVSEKNEEEADSKSPEVAAVRRPSAPAKAEHKPDLEEVIKKVAVIETEDELNKYWFSLKLSEKHAGIMKPYFAARKAEIAGENAGA